MIHKGYIKSIKEKGKRFFASYKDRGMEKSNVPFSQPTGLVHKPVSTKTHSAWIFDKNYCSSVLALESKDYPDLDEGDTAVYLNKDTYVIFKKEDNSVLIKNRSGDTFKMVDGVVEIKNKDGNVFTMGNGEVSLKKSDNVYLKIDAANLLSVKSGAGGVFDLKIFFDQLLIVLLAFQVVTPAGTINPATHTALNNLVELISKGMK